MSEIVNLNQARKAKARSEAGAQAARNRVTFGLSKAQKTLAQTARVKAGSILDGAKRET